MTDLFETGPDAPFIARRARIPHDGTRRILAVGRIGPVENAEPADDDLMAELAAAARAADGVKAVARTGHRVISQQQEEARDDRA